MWELVGSKSSLLEGSKPTVYTWNAIISAHTKLGESERATELYHRMQQQGVRPDKVTFLCILKACGSLKAIFQGSLMHDQILQSGLESNVIIGSTLVDMYAKCGRLKEAHKVFAQLSNRDVVAWGTIIAGYAQQGDGISALELFEQMQKEDIKPSIITFSSVLKACGSIQDIDQGRRTHKQISRSELDRKSVV